MALSPLQISFSNVNASCDKKDYYSLSVQPRLGEYQLLGDSIFVRFSNNILNQPSRFVDGCATVGFCVSGQRINQLANKIKKSVYTLTQKVILLIGTNDVLCEQSLPTMIRHYRNLIQLLRLRKVTKIVILTLPPVPKLALTQSHWERVRGFNQFLLGLDNEADQLRVIDILPMFLKQDSHVLAAPPQVFPCTVGCSGEPNVILSPSAVKRKTEGNDSDSTSSENLKKKKTPPDISLIEEDDSLLTPFGRYLNRVNRAEREEEVVSCEDEGRLYQAKPYIEYSFWRKLRRTMLIENIEILPPEGSPEPLYPRSPVHLLLQPTPQVPASPADEQADSSYSKMSELNKKIMEYTSTFIRLEYYEMFIGVLRERVDMVHPNIHGLRRLRSYLDSVL